MKALLKKILILGTALVLFALTLTSCALDDVFHNRTESFMEKILVGESYTAEYKSADDVYYTLMVAKNEMYCAMKTEEAINEIFLYQEKESGEYFYVTKSTIGEQVVINKQSLPKNDYLAQYAGLYTLYSRSDELFHYRHILEMMDTVKDANGKIIPNQYAYSEAEKIGDHYKKTEYSVKVVNDSLVLMVDIRDENWAVDEDMAGIEDGEQSVKTTTTRTTYTNVGKTVITIPQDVKDK